MNRRVLVTGGGISGLTAAIEASEAGCEVVLVEREPWLGGRVAQMHQYFPKLCPPACGLEINLRRLRTSPRVSVLTDAELIRLQGEPGRFKATIRQNPRGVNARCTGCGACASVCPVERPSRFDLGMCKTKAVYMNHELAHPLRYAIDASACKGSACGRCLAACPCDAIELELPPRELEMELQAVIRATGWEPYDAGRLVELGFGASPDVITNLMMERLASPRGPTQGRILRPSDGRAPAKVVFVQCAGSRDELHLPYCSSVCCMASLKQARYLRAQLPEVEIDLFYIDLRAPGRQELFLAESQRDPRLHLIKGKVASVRSALGGLLVEAEDVMTGTLLRSQADLVVLATGMRPSSSVEEPAPARDELGFLPGEAAGVFAAGCAREATDVASCVRDATRAAMGALQICVRREGGVA